MRPGLARVRGFVNAVTRHDVASNAGFAHADEYDIRIGFRNGNSSDGRTVDLPIRHRIPGQAVIRGLPQSTANSAEVGFVTTPLHTGHGNRAPALCRSDAAPLVAAE